MSLPLIVLLAAPLAGVAFMMLFGDDVPRPNRLLALFAAAVSLGGAAWAAVRTIAGSPVEWRAGFAMDPFRAILVFGALLACAAALARAEDAPRPSFARAAIFAAIAGSIAPLVVTGSHLLAVTIPVSTAGIAVVAFATVDAGPRLLRAARSIAALALSDVLALVGIGLAIGKGTAFPPRLSTLAGSLLLSAALIRLGLTPADSPARDAHDCHPAAGLLWLGPVRAQGFLLAVYAIGAHRSVAYAAAAAAASSLLVAGVTMSSRDRSATLPAVGAGVALLGLALGGATSTWGGALAVVATFAGTAAWYTGGAWSAVARATLTAVPAGGLAAAAALVVGAAFGAATSEPWFLALAVPAAAGLLAAAAAVWSIGQSSRGFGPAAFAGSIGVAAGLALAAVPERAMSWLAEPVARSLGVGRLLTVGGEPGIDAALALVAIGVAVVAFLVGPGYTASGSAAGLEPAAAFRSEGSTEAAAAPVAQPAFPDARRWAFAAMFLFAVSIGVAVRVYLSASARGFL